MSDRWAEILRTPPVAAAEWITLPENGWGAIIAYRVGPGRTRPHHVPVESRTVREVRTDADGTTHRHTMPMTAEDLAEIVDSVNSYLVEVGLPPSPFTWWEVAPPDGVPGVEFMRRLEDAATQRSTATSGPEVAHQYAAILAEEIDRIFVRGEAPA